MNPCDNNLYSSFIKSDKACDVGYAYYTCESFEELNIFANACMRHGNGAKVDAPKTTLYGHSKYAMWHNKVMKNRMEGKGRDIIADDGYVDPGLGSSRGEGQSHGAPVTDEELGNVPDSDKYVVDKGYRASMEMQNVYRYEPIMLEYEQDDSQQHQSLEVMIVSVWGILFSALMLCFCCALSFFCGLMLKKLIKKFRKKN